MNIRSFRLVFIRRVSIGVFALALTVALSTKGWSQDGTFKYDRRIKSISFSPSRIGREFCKTLNSIHSGSPAFAGCLKPKTSLEIAPIVAELQKRSATDATSRNALSALELMLQVTSSHGSVGLIDLSEDGRVTLLKGDGQNDEVVTPGKTISYQDVSSLLVGTVKSPQPAKREAQSAR